MRLRQPRTTALLLLLPALHVYAAKILSDTDATEVAPAGAESSDLAALVTPTPVPAARGTKDAPVDGFDGKPHEGPYVDDKPVASKKGPGGIEELRPGSRLSPSQDLTKEEVTALVDEDDSVMNDPNRAMPKGNTGTEGGVSAKDKERLAHEDKTGSKMEKVPAPPKEAPVLPHGEQHHIKEKQNPEPDTESRILGAQGLEVSHSFNCPHQV
jgi:hypothetical protein